MKKTLLILLVFFPGIASADIDVYLSLDEQVFYQDAWTSDIDVSQSNLLVNYRHTREDIPFSYISTEAQIRDRIFFILSDISLEERISRMSALLEINEDNFLQYLSIALSPDIDDDINAKKNSGILLTPFEEVFNSCNIDLLSRREIAINLIEHIYTQKNNLDFGLSDLEYSDMGFGDCIIPFPDNRRTLSQILDLETVFFSTHYNATIIQDSGNFLRFTESQEREVGVLTISGASFEQVQGLTMNSTRIETSHGIEKSHGKNRIIYVHKNHHINPFRNARINGNQVGGASYMGEQTFGIQMFNASHPLFIQENDSELYRTMQPWTEHSPGIFKKILLQENTFDENGLPRQIVGATSYYAIIYNHDITPPFCESTLFSHDGFGLETFLLPENPWFHTKKYIYFGCRDSESGCMCNSSMPGCFIRGERIFSSPQVIPHYGDVNHSFINGAGKITTCTNTPEQRIRYDFTSPDLRLYKNGSELNGLTREFVSNEGMLFDGNQISFKRFFGVREISEFQAGEVPEMVFEIFDPELSETIQTQETSGLNNIRIVALNHNGAVWQEIGVYENNTLEGDTIFSISLLDINNQFSHDIINRAGHYQLQFLGNDRAGNKVRATWQYTVRPGEIYVNSSTLEISERNIYFANNIDTYEYQLTLRDQFNNRISGREFQLIEHDCEGSLVTCHSLRSDMTQNIPSGNFTLDTSIIGGNISDENGRIFFEVSAKSPGVFTERFSINFLNPSVTHTFHAEQNSFLKLVTGVLETYDDGVWYSDRLFVGEDRYYRVETSLTGALVSPNFELVGDIRARHPHTSFTLSGSIVSHSNRVYFQGLFESSLSDSESHKTLLEIIENTKSGLVVSYDLGGENIRYRISESNRNDNILTLTDTRELDTPVRLIGGIQASGVHHNINERQNISDINSFLQRTNFRKNIAQHIMNSITHTNSRGIRYVDLTHSVNKNYRPSSNPSYQTLVVRNGNILITEDFNPTNQSIGIISYIDGGYDIDTGYSSVGNILISPNVRNINAFIYADGALLSATSFGIPITSYHPDRNNELQNQFTIKGAVFTRNTLAGGRESDGVFMLPGNRATSNGYLATQYDLYYLRRGNDGCIRDSYDFCNIPQYLIIEYDSRIISNPPPLFSQ